MNLPSPTLDLANEAGINADRGELHRLAIAEGTELVRRAAAERQTVDRDVMADVPACLDVAAHLSAGALGEAIYLHACVHTGFVTREPGKPYDVCPMCGDDLPRAAT